MPSRNNTPVSKKRQRSQSAETPSSATATAKKRRLLDQDESPAQSPQAAAAGLISSTVNGALNLGRRIVSGGRRQPVAEMYAPGDLWGMEEVAVASETTTTSQKENTKPPTPAKADTNSIYEVPDSDDELGSVRVAMPRTSREKRANGAQTASEQPKPEEPAATAQVDEPVVPVKRKRGRPRKVIPEPGAGGIEAANTPTKPQSTPRPVRSSARKVTETNLVQDASDGDAPSLIIAKTRRQKPTAVDSPRADTPQKLKGILSPRKRDGNQQSKNVTFNSASRSNKKAEVLFPDLAPKTAAAKSPTKSPRKRQQKALEEEEPEESKKGDAEVEVQIGESGTEESDDDEEDGEVCSICAKPDSVPGNEIVFCEICDMAVHQKCYGLAVIPEGDWICRNCSQDDVSSAAAVKGAGIVLGKQASVVTREDQKPDILNFDQHFGSMQRVLLDRCAGRRRIKLHGQDDAYDKTSQLVEQTIVAGEGNSMLVIGARGCGKTTLVESVVAEASGKYKDQFHVVRLNGFIHTDDKLALREIWRQLGKEMEVEDELISKTNNYADTLASLLALLSHPSEIAEAQDSVTSKSVIFLIDEFDLFATHARQTLLYNLFDIAQAKKAPIAVVGLTTRIDVVESLEKRVKSRFSHRYVYLSLPKSLPAYWDVCRQGLSIDDDDMLTEGIDQTLKGHREFWKWWMGKIEALRKTPSFSDHLESHFFTTKSVSAFLTTCILPLAGLSPSSLSLRIPYGGPDVSLEQADSKLHLLESLSELDLSMLIAAARLDIVAHTDTVNFAMAYDEYTSLMSRQRVLSATSGMLAVGGGTRVWGRGTAGIAWERLVALGLLVPAAPGGRAAGNGGLDAKMWKVDVALEEIPAAVKMNAVLSRWCREI
ncbi:origin recognition complex subunit 4 C-terminus-domain-containing protein [Podospora didyma]|uniref:Origin recognition complex subunit 4 n=1 Tax=Podospora didyma TaxID=330526 RepID=A0AAE0P0D4_9PEZI|nr:origin recognition complex subunit 4 C-terminus-domain-containing protein [Podospora didyma]